MKISINIKQAHKLSIRYLALIILFQLSFYNCSLIKSDFNEVEINAQAITTIEWSYIIAGQEIIEAKLSKDGTIYVLSTLPRNSVTGNQYFLNKIDKNGGLLWKKLMITSVTPPSFDIDADGNVYFVGYKSLTYNPTMKKLSTDGTLIWEKGGDELGINIPNPSGGYYYFAYSYSAIKVLNNGTILFGGDGMYIDFPIRERQNFVSGILPNGFQFFNKRNTKLKPNKIVELDENSYFIYGTNVFDYGIERLDSSTGTTLWVKMLASEPEDLITWNNKIVMLNHDFETGFNFSDMDVEGNIINPNISITLGGSIGAVSINSTNNLVAWSNADEKENFNLINDRLEITKTDRINGLMFSSAIKVINYTENRSIVILQFSDGLTILPLDINF